MRIPIFPCDLVHKTGGLGKIASALQSNWPDGSPISIFQAKLIVAHGLGYKSLQELTSHTLHSVLHEYEYSPNELTSNFYSTISATLKTQSLTDPEPSAISKLIELLPLHKLFIFRGLNSSVTSSKHSAHSPVVRRNNHFARILTTDELKKISLAALRSSDRRDVVMHELLRLGCRSHEVAGARISHSGLIQFPVKKSPSVQATLAKPVSDKLTKIVKAAGILPNSFLFPSSSGDKHIPSLKVARIFHSWVVKSGLNQLGITLHVFRRSVAAHRFNKIGSIH
jgi:integrase